MTDGFRLVMSQGPQPGQMFSLEKDSTSLGRDPGNDITIDDPQVSRQHARIMRQGGLMVIEDLGSTNGTFVNGVRLTGSHTLASGDMIGLGDVVALTYYGVGITATETVVRQPAAAPPSPSYAPSPSAPQPPPPPAYTAASPSPPVEEHEEQKSKTWLWVGCGCLAVVVLCGALFVLAWYLDANYPDILYAPLHWLGLF